jgi:hypothetical protein
VLASVLLAGSIAAPSLPADDASSWLRWNAPPGCPDRDHVARVVTRRLGRAPSPLDVAAEASIADEGAAGHRLHLHTDVGGRTDDRELVAHDCRALADAAALLIALSADPVAVAQHIEAAAEPAPGPLPAPTSVVPEPSPPATADIDDAPSLRAPVVDREAAPRPRARLGATAWAAGGIELGVLPGVGGAATVGVALTWPRARLELDGRWIGMRRASTDVGSVGVQLGAIAVRGCARVGSARVEVPLCGGAEGGAMRGDGDGARIVRVGHGGWIAALVATGVHGWVLPRLAVLARVELAVAAWRPEFQLTGPGEPRALFRPTPASGRLWVGLEVKLAGP